MGLLDTLKAGLKNLIKNTTKEQPEEEKETPSLVAQVAGGLENISAKTSPTQTETPTLNNIAASIDTSTPTQTRGDVLQSSINSMTLGQGNKTQSQTNDTTEIPIMNSVNINTGDILEGGTDDDANKEGTWVEKTANWLEKNIATPIHNKVDELNNAITGIYAKGKAEQKQKTLALGYNKDNDDVLYLDFKGSKGLTDDWWGGDYNNTAELFNKILDEEFTGVDENSQEDMTKALERTYARTKDLFRLRGDDLYSDNILTWNDIGDVWHRRKDDFSAESLEKLSKNNLKSGTYTPTYEEFVKFIGLYDENSKISRATFEEYGYTQPEEENVTYDDNKESVRKAKLNEIAYNGVNYITSQIGEKYVNDSLLAYNTAIQDQFDRVYDAEARIFALRDAIMKKPEAERTEGEKAIVDTANTFDLMDVELAKGLNDWFRLMAEEGTDDDGRIHIIDKFSDGRNLNDVLTDGVKRVSGKDWANNPMLSNIDVYNEMANTALYKYEQERGGTLGNLWEKFQRGTHYVGMISDEIGQTIYGAAVGGLPYMATLGNYKGGLEVSSYVNQDFSIGAMLGSDLASGGSVMRNYLLQASEYVPEFATGWYNIGKITKVPNALSKVGKYVKGLDYIKKINNTKTVTAINKGLNATVNALSKVTGGEGNLRTGFKIVNKLLKDGIIDQAIDGMVSNHDTEAYSTTSAVLSLGGTVLTELMPIMLKSDIPGIFKSTIGNRGIRDVADFVSSSDEAADLVAKLLGKEFKDVTFDELKVFAKDFSNISDATRTIYQGLSAADKQVVDLSIKNTMYNYIKQAFGAQSEMAKQIRSLVLNNSATPADIFKYATQTEGNVVFGPYSSVIKLKNGSKGVLVGKYNYSLDNLEGGFVNKVKNGFSLEDIEQMSKLDGFSDIKGKIDNLFYENDGKYYLNEDGLKRFGLGLENMSLESLGISLKEGEFVKGRFKESLKGISNSGKRIKDNTIDDVAESGAYFETVNKVKEIVC